MGNDDMIISRDRYEALIEAKARITIFADFVKKSSYITREDCAMFFDFDLPQEVNADA